MLIKLTTDQKFLIPLQNVPASFLLVKEIDFLGNGDDHEIPQIHYKGTMFKMDMDTEELSKEQNYTLVMDEEYNTEYGEND